MNKSSSASTRAFAAASLVIALIAAIVVIGGALGGGDSNGSGEREKGGQATRQDGDGQRPVPATYVVKSGDTLTAIARETGVSVARIEVLNPRVDPQILIAGEKLKLR